MISPGIRRNAEIYGLIPSLFAQRKVINSTKVRIAALRNMIP
jgi:hypothetical protein